MLPGEHRGSGASPARREKASAHMLQLVLLFLSSAAAGKAEEPPPQSPPPLLKFHMAGGDGVWCRAKGHTPRGVGGALRFCN